MKKINKLLISIILILIALISFSSIYAWNVYTTSASRIKLKITKIDSIIYMFSSYDSNKNGTPDLLSSVNQEIALEYAPIEKKSYYLENRAFKYISREYAQSESNTLSTTLNYTYQNALPTQVETIKYSVINNSEGKNYISFKFNDKEYNDAYSLSLLKTLSVRVGVVRNSGGINSSNINIEYSNTMYFYNNIDNKCNEFYLNDILNPFEIEGQITKDITKNNDVLDFWVQVEMCSFDELQNNISNFQMTEEEYQSLTNKSILLPDLDIILELRT